MHRDEDEDLVEYAASQLYSSMPREPRAFFARLRRIHDEYHRSRAGLWESAKSIVRAFGSETGFASWLVEQLWPYLCELREQCLDSLAIYHAPLPFFFGFATPLASPLLPSSIRSG